MKISTSIHQRRYDLCEILEVIVNFSVHVEIKCNDPTFQTAT